MNDNNDDMRREIDSIFSTNRNTLNIVPYTLNIVPYTLNILLEPVNQKKTFNKYEY